MYPYNRRSPLQTAGIVVAAILVLFLFGACTYAMYQSGQSGQAAQQECEAAGGFYEWDDGECEFPDGSEWGDGD